MLWIKFVLGLLVIAFCTFLGYLSASKYRNRRSFYAQLSDFNEKYLAELKYARKPLNQFLSDMEFKGDFSKIIHAYVFERKIELDYSYLTKAEKEEAAEYFRMLGRGDSRSQSGYFSAQADTLLESKNKSEKDAKSYTDLYVKLGLLAGLAIVILIV